MLIDILKPDFEFKDERGMLIQLVRCGYSQFNVITSVENSLRGGHFHQENNEAFYIIDGILELDVWLQGQEAKERYTFSSGEMFAIPANVVHSFNFVSATTLVSMYSKGVEYPDGSKDIIAVEEGEVPASHVMSETGESLILKVENTITTLQKKNLIGVYESICQKQIFLDKTQNFEISFSVQVFANSDLRWYVLRSKKIKIKIERILYVFNGEVVEEGCSNIYYHEGEKDGDGWIDMLTLDPCVDFVSSNQTIDEVVIRGKWIIDATENELTNVYYRKLDKVAQQYEEKLRDLQDEKHRIENALKIANKKNEKSEIYIELLKKDVALRDALVEKYIGK